MILLLLVLFSGDPHVLKRGQTCQNAASFPAHCVSGAWRKQSGFSLTGQEGFKFFYESLWKAFKHGVSSRENNLVVKV